jgi:hypothetical protein
MESHFPTPPFYPSTYDAPGVRPSQLGWDSFPLLLTPQQLDQNKVFPAISKLFVIINEYMIIKDTYAALSDKEASFENAKLLRAKLLAWADDLPAELIVSPTCLPVAINVQYVVPITLTV